MLTGVAGEYFVAGELSRRGHIASITLRNTRGIDVLVTNSAGSKQVGIQVKTNKGNRKAWILHEKAEKYFNKHLFYVFVNLIAEGEKPDFYIVPSKVVAKDITTGHIKHCKTPGLNGRLHKDTSMRMFYDKEDKYLEKWSILGL